ncbi:hypothetical protein [Victivallis sp. Marseille-Q1083]|uniref:hypothetical protein n=1 Tax=Victivallis sp. Marseille-Q1083 TaxID=2717288 RepID=UPI00158BB3A0|nr:hypothetical protein [Victivallis sp. Marseille-Q1083]
MINKVICFILCGSIILGGGGSLANADNGDIPQSKEKILNSDELSANEKSEGENEKIASLWQQARKNQKERYWWSVIDEETKREELIAKDNDNAVMRQFYHDFTDSSLQTILTQYASFPEVFPYVITDYNFLKAYREFLAMLKLYTDCTQQDYELAVQAEAQQESPMRFLLKQQIQNIGKSIFKIITPSGLKHTVKVDDEGYFEILSCEIPEHDEQNMLMELADWEARWEYGTELLKTFPSMTFYDLKRNMSNSVRNASIFFQPQKQSGRYLLDVMKRYCILEDGKRLKSLIGYTRVIVEVTYLPKDKKYELKSKILFSDPPIKDSVFTYDAETEKPAYGELNSITVWIMIMLHNSSLPSESVTREQCWSADGMQYELTSVGIAQDNLFARVKEVAVSNSTDGYLEGSFLFDLNKGKYVSADYHYVKTTKERDVLIEVNIRSLDE